MKETELEKISAGTKERKSKLEVPEDIKASVGGFEYFKKRVKDSGNIVIKPLVHKDKENFGLEKYNMVIFPTAIHKEDLTCLEYNGTYRYVTGLDEFAPEVQMMEDLEMKSVTIKTIREIVSHLEKVLASNKVDPNDENFWDKVKKVRPDNIEFWSQVKIELTNTQKELKPLEDPNDLILLMAIEAGGFSTVAKSYEDAISSPNPPRFFLDKKIVTAEKKATYKKLRNKAIAMLDELFEKNISKVLYIAKVLDAGSTNYKRSTPKDILYDFLDEYINGLSYEENKTKAPEKFMELCKVDTETLMLKAMVKDAINYRIIVPKPDGSYYFMKNNSFVGKNTVDILAYMKNPTNDDVMKMVLKEVEKYW